MRVRPGPAARLRVEGEGQVADDGVTEVLDAGEPERGLALLDEGLANSMWRDLGRCPAWAAEGT